MTKNRKITLVVVGLLAIIGLTVGVYGVNTSNYEIDLRNQAEAQYEVNKSYADKMWKTIQQQAEVSNEYKDAFMEIYPELIAGRYSTERGGALMSWITEANPDFDVSLYGKLMNTIEAQREGFFNEQKKLISIMKQHEDLREKFPSALFVGGREKLDYPIVTSKETEEIFETGQENDIKLFD